MLNPIGEIAGFKVFEDPYIQPVLKYPTGYKDGNKLGKRKKELLVQYAYVINNAIFVNSDQHAQLKDFVSINQAKPWISRSRSNTPKQPHYPGGIDPKHVEMGGEMLEKTNIFDEDPKDPGYTYDGFGFQPIIKNPSPGVIIPKV